MVQASAQMLSEKRKEKEKTTQAVNTTPHINQGKGATLVPSTVTLLHREKERKNQWGSRGSQACSTANDMLLYLSCFLFVSLSSLHHHTTYFLTTCSELHLCLTLLSFLFLCFSSSKLRGTIHSCRFP
jgi:hypothetical protein